MFSFIKTVPLTAHTHKHTVHRDHQLVRAHSFPRNGRWEIRRRSLLTGFFAVVLLIPTRHVAHTRRLEVDRLELPAGGRGPGSYADKMCGRVTGADCFCKPVRRPTVGWLALLDLCV